MSARIVRLQSSIGMATRGLLACLLVGFSGIYSQACGSDADTIQEVSFLYIAWTEPVAGGWPVMSQSVYLASNGAQQNARFTDRGDLFELEESERSTTAFQELVALLDSWIREPGKPVTPAAEKESAPIAVDFHAPRITVALGSPSGSWRAESWLESDLPPVLAPLIKRAREINARRLGAVQPGSFMRLEPAMVERIPEIAMEAADVKKVSPLAEVFSSPWRFVSMPAPIAVRGTTFVKERPRFVSLAERIFLLRVFTLDPTTHGYERPNRQKN